MKKILIFILLFAISFSFVAFADVPADELPSLKSQYPALNLSENEQAIEFYHQRHLFHEIANGAKIEDLIQSTPGKKHFIIFQNDKEQAYYKTIDGENVKEFSYGTNKESVYRFYQYALQPEKVFKSSVDVEAVYCFNAGVFTHDPAIYFKTDKGEFVLFYDEFSEGFNSRKMYLIPFEDFCNLSKSLIEARNENPDTVENHLSQVADLTQYRFSEIAPRKFPWWSVLAVATTLVSALASSFVTIAVLKKKKSQQ